MKDLGLAIGLGAITLVPFVAISGIVIGGFYLLKKYHDKKPDTIARIGEEMGVEAEWPNLQDFEVEFYS